MQPVLWKRGMLHGAGVLLLLEIQDLSAESKEIGNEEQLQQRA